MLWIYIAAHGFASSQRGSSKQQWPGSWRNAAIMIAQGPTPLLVAGGEMDVDQIEAGQELQTRFLWCQVLQMCSTKEHHTRKISTHEITPHSRKWRNPSFEYCRWHESTFLVTEMTQGECMWLFWSHVVAMSQLTLHDAHWCQNQMLWIYWICVGKDLLHFDVVLMPWCWHVELGERVEKLSKIMNPVKVAQRLYEPVRDIAPRLLVQASKSLLISYILLTMFLYRHVLVSVERNFQSRWASKTCPLWADNIENFHRPISGEISRPNISIQSYRTEPPGHSHIQSPSHVIMPCAPVIHPGRHNNSGQFI